ncbi:hypothetical protein N7513_011784 [Penicillium frequentans]|nr:hypothetical protein N7513_011784 [Penicillium glabrum]
MDTILQSQMPLLALFKRTRSPHLRHARPRSHDGSSPYPDNAISMNLLYQYWNYGELLCVLNVQLLSRGSTAAPGLGTWGLGTWLQRLQARTVFFGQGQTQDDADQPKWI